MLFDIIDVVLLVSNALLLVVGLGVAVNSDHPLKEVLMRWTTPLHRLFAHSGEVSFMLLSALTVWLWSKYYRSVVGSKNDSLIVVEPLTMTDSLVVVRAIVSSYTWVLHAILRKLAQFQTSLGPDKMMALEQETERYYIENYEPPSPTVMNFLMGPLKTLLRPCAEGIENIPHDEPCLFVMNHQLYGLEMGPFLDLVYSQRMIFLRGLGDRFHFLMPQGEVLRFLGAVNGTRSNVDCLMQSSQNILVYPGGRQEVMKKCSIPNYTLPWRERLGFARMAIKHGYSILPCAGVGTEEMMDRLFDIPVPFMKVAVPVIGPILPHRLQRLYIWFGKPISTKKYKGDWQNDEFARAVRDDAKKAIEEGIKHLKTIQAADPNRFLYQYLRNVVLKAFHSPARNGNKPSHQDINKIE